ncbi:MAG: hypothetical protein HY216_08260 [Candidatus Rokubacteria bacterium]|nr:hypothetical protein [Candidatus Rokubacteria bacterium]
MTLRWPALVAASLVFTSCALVNPPIAQRTTQGPMAEDMWTYRMALQNGRTPNYDERQRWDADISRRVDAYLREHPDAANAPDVTAFRFWRQPAVGMTKEQVLLLLDAPALVTTDQDAMSQLAGKFWPLLEGNVTEAWAYLEGWQFYFAGQRVVDILQIAK